ncbi:MAG: hypothetical protein OXG25_01435 [Gammaproteobacteria bacterium]|nr:hypothetical protein [Gammaproteobacteria bacterium]
MRLLLQSLRILCGTDLIVPSLCSTYVSTAVPHGNTALFRDVIELPDGTYRQHSYEMGIPRMDMTPSNIATTMSFSG